MWCWRYENDQEGVHSHNLQLYNSIIYKRLKVLNPKNQTLYKIRPLLVSTLILDKRKLKTPSNTNSQHHFLALDMHQNLRSMLAVGKAPHSSVELINSKDDEGLDLQISNFVLQKVC